MFVAVCFISIFCSTSRFRGSSKSAQSFLCSRDCVGLTYYTCEKYITPIIFGVDLQYSKGKVYPITGHEGPEVE
jgi:hypothetical protein